MCKCVAQNDIYTPVLCSYLSLFVWKLFSILWRHELDVLTFSQDYWANEAWIFYPYLPYIDLIPASAPASHALNCHHQWAKMGTEVPAHDHAISLQPYVIGNSLFFYILRELFLTWTAAALHDVTTDTQESSQCDMMYSCHSRMYVRIWCSQSCPSYVYPIQELCMCTWCAWTYSQHMYMYFSVCT